MASSAQLTTESTSTRSARIGDVDHDGRLVKNRQHLSDRRFIARRWWLSDAFLFGDFSALLG